MNIVLQSPIKAIIGLGNPGKQYYRNRHNIGFQVVDLLAGRHEGSWTTKDALETTTILMDDHKIILIKPQTFMNNSGKVIPWLLKQGIKPENILVVHDELELPFGKLKIKFGGSAKGHNGLRSIIEAIGPDFPRLACGIGRPPQKEMVPVYVLQDFQENPTQLNQFLSQAADLLENIILQAH